MSARLKRNLPILQALLHASPVQRRLILQTASKELILSVCEVAFNILRGVIPLSTLQYRRLARQKTAIKLVANKKIGVVRKREAINQQGGFIGPLLSIAVPFLTELLMKR